MADRSIVNALSAEPEPHPTLADVVRNFLAAPRMQQLPTLQRTPGEGSAPLGEYIKSWGSSTPREPNAIDNALSRVPPEVMFPLGFLARRPAPMPVERPSVAALRIGNNVYRGANHGMAMSKAEAELGADAVWKHWNRKTGFGGDAAEGFVTTTGRFVSRDEATELLRRLGEWNRDVPGFKSQLHSSELRAGSPSLFSGKK